MTRRFFVTLAFLLLLPLTARAQETTEYYATDALGSVRAVFDQTGGVVARTDYLPFGEEVFAPGPVPKERFTGQERDGEVGQDYFRARMMQTRVGRFSTHDPVDGAPRQPQSFNRYGYTLQNPLSYTDPKGTTPYKLVCMTVESGEASNTGDPRVDFHGGVTLTTVCRYVADPTIEEPTYPNPGVPENPTGPAGPTSSGPGGVPSANNAVLEKPLPKRKSRGDLAACLLSEGITNFAGDDDTIYTTVAIHVAWYAARRGAAAFLPGPGWLYTGVMLTYDAVQVGKAVAECTKEK